MKYVLRICDLHLAQTKQNKFPLIFPAVIYTGKRPYSATRTFWDLFIKPDQMKKYLVEPYVLSLRDLGNIDIRDKYHAGVILTLMQKIHSQDIFPHLKKLFPLLQVLAKKNLHLVEDLLKLILRYGETRHDAELVQLFVGVVPEEHRGNIMTIGERLIEKGKRQGILLGIEKGMEKGRAELIKIMLQKKLSLSEISSITNLSIDEIERLK